MREMGDHGYFGQSSAVSPFGLYRSELWIDMSACGSLTLDSAGLAVGVGFGTSVALSVDSWATFAE